MRITKLTEFNSTDFIESIRFDAIGTRLSVVIERNAEEEFPEGYEARAVESLKAECIARGFATPETDFVIETVTRDQLEAELKAAREARLVEKRNS